MMSMRTLYSYACAATAAFAATVLALSLGGCFSERSGLVDTGGEDLCSGTLPANTVRIQDFSFAPAQLEVPAGTTVRFVNCGPSGHSSTADAGDGWDSGTMARFATYEVAFPTVGTNPYHCDPHPSMTGRIVVR